ncbi:flippase [Lacticaseibacillus paracasei]|uniref:flippase n=1 Tax=Lacticaseibacillus paracasei TaxID=1597 RepID=UPI002B22B261|nr:flippase [Lacticaseibacillus paracasei]MEB0329405.1 flippase [Lacticaseibacillus paracasei]
MKIIKNFLWNAGFQVFVLIVPLITIPYINRVLGPTGVGINAFTTSIVQYFVLFGSLGINLYGNRQIAYLRDDRREMSQTFWEITIIRFICTSIAMLLYFIFVIFTDKYRVYYLAQGLVLFATAFDISWFFQGQENFRVTVLRGVFVRLISLVLVFVFVRRADDTLLYIIIMSVTQVIGNWALWPYLKGQIEKASKWSSLRIVRHIRPSFMLLVPQIATQIYLQLNKTMLGIFQDVTAAGFFDNSDKIIKMLLAVVTATGTVLLPHVAHSFARGDKAAVNRSLEVSMHVILVMAIPLAFGISAVANTFTYYFFSDQFMPVADLMALEAIVVLPISIANAIGIQYLLPTNQMRPYTTSVILGSIANVMLNIPLIIAWGAMGAVISTILTEALVMAYQMFYVRKQVQLGELFSETWKYFLAGLVMYADVRLLENLLERSIAHLVMEVIIGGIVYVIVLLLLKPHHFLSYFKLFKQ